MLPGHGDHRYIGSIQLIEWRPEGSERSAWNLGTGRGERELHVRYVIPLIRDDETWTGRVLELLLCQAMKNAEIPICAGLGPAYVGARCELKVEKEFCFFPFSLSLSL